MSVLNARCIHRWIRLSHPCSSVHRLVNQTISRSINQTSRSFSNQSDYDEIAPRRRDSDWRERYGMESRSPKPSSRRKQSTKRSSDQTNSPADRSVNQTTEQFDAEPPARTRGRPRKSESSAQSSDRYNDERPARRSTKRSDKQSTSRPRSPITDYDELAPVRNRFELEHDVEFVDESYDPELDPTFQSIKQSGDRSINDDDRFPDIISPRAKLRGKGIAGSGLLQRHLAHGEGVIEQSIKQSSKPSFNQVNDPTVNRSPSGRVPAAARKALGQTDSQSSNQSNNELDNQRNSGREPMSRSDDRSNTQTRSRSTAQSDDPFERFGRSSGRTSIQTDRFDRSDRSDRSANRSDRFDRSTGPSSNQFNRTDRFSTQPKQADPFAHLISPNPAPRQSPPPSWEHRFDENRRAHATKLSDPSANQSNNDSVRRADPYVSLLKQPSGTVSGFDSWLAELKKNAQTVVDQRTNQTNKQNRRKDAWAEWEKEKKRS